MPEVNASRERTRREDHGYALSRQGEGRRGEREGEDGRDVSGQDRSRVSLSGSADVSSTAQSPGAIPNFNTLRDQQVSARCLSDQQVSVRDVSDQQVSVRDVSDQQVSVRDVSDQQVSVRDVSDQQVSVRDVSDQQVSVRGVSV